MILRENAGASASGATSSSAPFEFQGNPDHWNGRDDKNGYTEGKWLAQRKRN